MKFNDHRCANCGAVNHRGLPPGRFARCNVLKIIVYLWKGRRHSMPCDVVNNKNSWRPIEEELRLVGN